LVCFLTILPAAAPAPGEKLHSLRGQILDDLTGRPITDVALALSNVHWEPVGEVVTPDSEGRFTFHGLEAGEYVLGASRLDFGTIFWGQLPDTGWFETIDVGPSDEDKDVVFRLVPPGVVTGTVRDESGDPIVGATVALLRREWSDGRTGCSRGFRRRQTTAANTG
jgi:5-hydroxyisourate hydrolase-like protein (transthyretin family)